MMKRVKITVKRMARYEDLMAEYENPIQNACDMRLGQTFVVENCEKPEGMCQSAWETMLPFVKELSDGGGDFFDGWMRNPHSAMLSCNDGFRPVSFLVEAVEDAIAEGLELGDLCAVFTSNKAARADELQEHSHIVPCEDKHHREGDKVCQSPPKSHEYPEQNARNKQTYRH